LHESTGIHAGGTANTTPSEILRDEDDDLQRRPGGHVLRLACVEPAATSEGARLGGRLRESEFSESLRGRLGGELSANDTELGMKLDYGKTVHAKVSDVMNGDKLIVSSIH